MPKFIPFTAHVRIVPDRGSGRKFDYVRDMQKIATRVYEQLVDDTDLAIATPGGGQQQSLSGDGGQSGLSYGTAVKPQIGNYPAQLMITGYLLDNGSTAQAHPDKPVIHTGEYLEGAGGSHGWKSNPATVVDGYAIVLKSKIESAVAAVLGATDWSVHRLEVSGVIYGDRGHHFPS